MLSHEGNKFTHSTTQYESFKIIIEPGRNADVATSRRRSWTSLAAAARQPPLWVSETSNVQQLSNTTHSHVHVHTQYHQNSMVAMTLLMMVSLNRADGHNCSLGDTNCINGSALLLTVSSHLKMGAGDGGRGLSEISFTICLLFVCDERCSQKTFLLEQHVGLSSDKRTQSLLKSFIP